MDPGVWAGLCHMASPNVCRSSLLPWKRVLGGYLRNQLLHRPERRLRRCPPHPTLPAITTRESQLQVPATGVAGPCDKTTHIAAAIGAKSGLERTKRKKRRLIKRKKPPHEPKPRAFCPISLLLFLGFPPVDCQFETNSRSTGGWNQRAHTPSLHSVSRRPSI